MNLKKAVFLLIALYVLANIAFSEVTIEENPYAVIMKNIDLVTSTVKEKPVAEESTSEQNVASFLARVKVNIANLRKVPSLEGEIVGKTSLGTEYKVIGIEGDFYEITIDEKSIAYIHKSVCDLVQIKTEIRKENEPSKAPAIENPVPREIPKPKSVPQDIEVSQAESKQTRSAIRIAYIGGKLGVNISLVSGEAIEDFDIDEQGTKQGLCVGGFITIKLSDYIGLQPEIIFSSKGCKDLLDYETQKTRLVLTYLEIPLLAKIFFPVGKTIEPNLYLGPYFSFLISQKLIENGESYNINEVGSSDLGIVIGGGVDVLKKVIKVGNLHVDVRYSIGLTDIYSNNEAGSKNSAFTFMIGYSF